MEGTLLCTVYSRAQNRCGPAFMNLTINLDKEIINKWLFVVSVYIKYYENSQQGAMMENN